MKRIITVFLLSLTVSFTANSQVVYEHISNSNIYSFLDELANDKIIDINSTIKPYSRVYIANLLVDTKSSVEELTTRQKKELEFYLQAYQIELDYPLNLKYDLLKKRRNVALAYNPIGAYYKDSLTSIWLKPILGYEYFTNDNGSLTHSWGGLEFGGYIGKHIGFYTSLRDNNLSRNVIRPEYFIQDQGVPVKHIDGGIDYSEARGGINYSWNWGSIGLIKDHIQWGSNYFGSNIMSGRTPSYGMIKLNLKPAKWFEFNYYHGWLVSSVVDSSRSYWENDRYRTVFHPKYIAANMFTFKPWKGFNFSLGNSIVYSDIGVQAAYLIPFLFYKSVDHTLNSTYQHGDAGQNSQMFFDISSRNIKHLHLYATLFIDEIQLRSITDNENSRNHLSVKGGFKVSDWLVENTWLSGEYTRSNPLVYQNYLSTVTFESNQYSLGHYMRDNSDVLNFAVGYKPIRGLHISATYSYERHGDDYDYATVPSSSGLPFMENVKWKRQIFLFSAVYEFVNNAYVYAKYQYSDITGEQDYIKKYTPEYYWGKTSTVTVGCYVGF
ncbi:MAG: hypothetical protein HQ521_10840 [Bacteroidetes bacterium]|nr:hypothetical protein [Bacteroidota bacterium]